MKGYQYVKGFTILCPAITFGICLVGVIFNRPLLSLFGLGAEAMEYGKYMLLIYLAAGTVRTCNYIMNTCYRAGGEAIFGTVLEIICLYTISVPATWVAGMVLHLPFLAVFAFLYTDELIRMAHDMDDKPPKREMDMLLTIGEQMSVSLMAMVMHKLGVPAVSLNAFQVTMHTTSSHQNARLKRIDTERIRRELDARRIVIVTGFQGVDKYDCLLYTSPSPRD